MSPYHSATAAPNWKRNVHMKNASGKSSMARSFGIVHFSLLILDRPIGIYCSCSIQVTGVTDSRQAEETIQQTLFWLCRNCSTSESGWITSALDVLGSGAKASLVKRKPTRVSIHTTIDGAGADVRRGRGS